MTLSLQSGHRLLLAAGADRRDTGAGEAAVAALLDAGELVIARGAQRPTYADDIRPYVRSLALCDDEPPVAGGESGTDRSCGATTPVVVHAELGTQPRALRPPS